METAITGENIALDILHEDDQLIVLNKPAGMVVHPAPAIVRQRSSTRSSPIAATRCPALAGKSARALSIGSTRTQAALWWRPKLMPRICRSAQFAAHGRDGRMRRSYQALVWGTPLPGLGKVDASLARAPHNRRKMAVSTHESARHAVTHYQVQESFLDGQVTRLACHLETGRTHQIRVHMAHIGHPVLGDPLYGAGMKSRASHLDATRSRAEALARQALHAAVLGFDIRPPARAWI